MPERAHRAIAFRRRRRQAHPNVQPRTKELKTICALTPEATHLLQSAIQALSLSARSSTKVLKIARAIADLSQQETIQPDHLAEAIQYRSLDRQLWL